jgi:hypothetical protein
MSHGSGRSIIVTSWARILSYSSSRLLASACEMYPHRQEISSQTRVSSAFSPSPRPPFPASLCPRLTQRFQTLTQTALTASKHRSVAKCVGTGFRFSQFLDQIQEVRRIIGFKRDDKLLIVETE